VGELISLGAVKLVAWPININNCHWTTMILKIEDDMITLEYADSLSFPKPQDLFAKVQCWMMCLNIHKPFMVEIWTIPRQDNDFLCGVCVWSTIENIVFNRQLWSPACKYLL
jgi:Ulp1 family protease